MLVSAPNSGLCWGSWGARAVHISKQPENGNESVELLLRVPRFPGRTLGERIRRSRLELGLYQAQLARRAGLDEMTLVNWEKDRTVPRERKLARLARALGLEPIELVDK